MVEDCLSPPIMHGFISARQRTKRHFFPPRIWDPDSVCGSSGSAQAGVGLPYDSSYVHTYLYLFEANSRNYVHYKYIYILRTLEQSIHGPREWVVKSPSTAFPFLHQSCSTFHPQPHTSVGFHTIHPWCSPLAM